MTHDAVTHEGTPRAEPTTADEVLAVLDKFAAAWSDRDLRRVVALWDEQEVAPTYVADELGEVLVGRSAIVEHLSRTEHRLATVRLRIAGVRLSSLADDLVLAVFHCRWELEWVSYARVVVVLRRRAGAWRFVHYSEAPFHTEDWGGLRAG